jgi:hypothetical protein
LRFSARARLFAIAFAWGVCVLAAPSPAAAEWHITPMIGVTFAGGTTFVDLQDAVKNRHTDFGGAVALLGAGIIGAEAIVVITPGFFEASRTPLSTDLPPPKIESSRTAAVMGNVVLTTPRRWTEYGLRPFVSGGFGLLHVSQTPAAGERGLGVHARVGGFNLGGGAIGFLTPKTGVRFDLRYYRSLRQTDQGEMAFGLASLHYMTASVGLVFRR